MSTNNHIWNFSTVGGVIRVNLESGEDLLALDHLDQKLWTALSCPVEGLEIDSKTLSLIDLDGDGSIRVSEILEAVKWICANINNPDELLRQNKSLPLSSINQNSEEGKNLYKSAHEILQNLKLSEASSIGIEQTSDLSIIFANTKLNGDGIITPNSTDDKELKNLIQIIINHTAALDDRSGKKGIGSKNIELFYDECQKYNDWLLALNINQSQILSFGQNTEEALTAFSAVKTKIADYFVRLKLVRFDEEAANVLNTLVKSIELISHKDLSNCEDDIASYPLAKITSKNTLQLKQGINPAWQKKINAFYLHVVIPKLGQIEELSENDWQILENQFSAYIDWKGSKQGESVEALGIENIIQILQQDKQKDLHLLVQEDLSVETEANNIILVDKLVRYYCDIFRLLNNFVTFYDFYSPEEKAIFQNGTLFIDQRSCDLCIKVSDMDKHSTMVALSGMFLIYCDCVSKATNQKMTIVAAMTNGDIDNLIVGRNAIYYDRNGLDWDATVIKIIDNPISIRQAFFSPYRKVAKFIESQAEKFAQAKEKEEYDKATANLEGTATQIVEPPKASPTPFDIGKFVGIFAAISLALGAIGGILASFISGFLGLLWWQMPLALVCIIIAISGPSMIIAWLKLRKRNLAPILDANGWAINASAVINIPFGNTLTNLVKLPLNAKINLNDPFIKKKNPFLNTLILIGAIILLLLFMLWKQGTLQKWLGN